MNKSEFLSELESNLKKLEKDECRKFITYYEEMIEDYKDNGVLEAEAIKKIGSPKSIANEILSEQDTVMITIPSTGSRKINAILLILGFPLWGSLLLAVALCVLSAYIVIWCIPFTTGVSAIGIFITMLVSILGSPFVMVTDSLAVGLVQFGIGIASIGISVLLAIVTVYLVKKFVPLSKSFTLKLVRSFQRKVVRI